VIKIKLYELDKHRNECTFRPFVWAQQALKDVGIEFTTGNSYDYAWVAQASIIDKKASLSESTEKGLEFLSNITGDYMIIDGQDSTSLIGTYEVFKESNALLMLKNSLLKDRSLYKTGLVTGRYYWGTGDYILSDFDEYSSRIVLSGANWLTTHWAGIKIQWHDYSYPKDYDVCAMFQYPSPKLNYEYNIPHSIYYDKHRKPVLDVIDNLQHKYSSKLATLQNGERVTLQEYYQRISNSKIILAPFGYGEMAPRDLEAAMFGSILIKPDMSFIDTIPNPYIDGETYIACKHDYSDLQEKLDMILGNYNNFSYIIENARKKYMELMHPNYVAIQLHKIFSNLNDITVE